MMTADAGVMNMSDLKDLAPLATRINAASDELTKTLDTIQQRLNDLALGVEVWLETELDHHVVERSDEHQTIEASELGYGRHGDKWALLVRRVHYTEVRTQFGDWAYQDASSVELDRKALTKASRPQRVSAVKQIPALINALREKAMLMIDAVDEAKKIAASLT